MGDESNVVIVEGIQFFTEILLGSGSYSNVYQGSWNSTPCVLKVFKDKIAKKYKDLLHTEAKHWAKLRHQNVVQFYGLYTDPDATLGTCIVLEYLPYNLRKFVEERFPKSPDEHLLGFKCSILIDVALALRYMQSIKMAHRDLTPNNVLLTRSFRAKVTDFGTSRFYDRLDNIGMKYTKQRGTKDFMPPEALGEEKGYKIDYFATDQFSFGCLMLFVLVHKWPEPITKDVRCKEDNLKIELTRNEFERREHHVKRLGAKAKEYFELPLKVCLSDDPQKRKDIEWMYNQLLGMKCYDEKYQRDEYYSKILEVLVLGDVEDDEQGQPQPKKTNDIVPSDHSATLGSPKRQSMYYVYSFLTENYYYIIFMIFIIMLSYVFGLYFKHQVFSNSTST